MSKHTRHRAKRTKRQAARMIQAAAKQGPILMEAVGIDWITAADAGDGDGDGKTKPKRFSMTAYTGGPMQVSNYGPPVVIDLSGLTAKAPIPIFRDHDPSRVIGHADDASVGASSLKLTGLISGAGPDAAEVQAAALNGFPWKASVGARPDKLEFVGEGVKTIVNGKTFTGPLEVARKSTLGEVSFVAMAADRKATTRIAATAAPTKTKEASAMKTFQEWIKALGFSPEDLREDQTQLLQAKYDAEVKAAADLKKVAEIKAAESKDPKKIEAAAKPVVAEVPTFDLKAVEKVYAQHENAIKATAADYRKTVPETDYEKLYDAAIKGGLEAMATALKEEWAAVRLEAEYIKAAALFKADLMVAERPKGPAIHNSSQDVSMPAIEAAFCRTIGLSDREKHFKPEVLEASDKFVNMGLQEMLLICASQNGYTGRFRIGPDNIAEVIRAAFSTHTITTLLTSTGNKMLLDGFNRVPQTWRQICAIKPVTDFKQVTAYRMTASLEYEKLGPGGLIKHGTLGQETYTRQVKTYAKMFALERTDIINDDLGAFDDLRDRIGMGGAIAMNKRAWTVWLAAVNAGTFWTAARGNVQTGGATAFGEAALNTAVKLFRDATGPDGNLIELEPMFVMVPSDLEATARKTYVSQEMRDTTADTNYPTANAYFNRFKPVVVPQLSTSSYTGYSATGWFLVADPAILASMAASFLNGVQAPTIESTDADFTQLGIQSRGFHDFGFDMSEYRASVHSAGA